MCFSAEEKDLGLPNLRLTPNMLMLGEDTPRPGAWSMRTGWTLEQTPFWNIAWCDEDKARVKMEDAAGHTTSDASFMYVERKKHNGLLVIDSNRWLPGKGSKWVRVKGMVPFAVSLQDTESKPVAVKLEKGFSVPVVLKGAGLADADGRHADVKAVLKVEQCRNVGKDEESIEIRLLTGSPLGFRGLGLQAQTLALVLEDSLQDREAGVKDGSYVWGQTWWFKRLQDREINIVVRYAENPRLVEAAVDAGWALSGPLAENEERVNGAGRAALEVPGCVVGAGESGFGTDGLSATAALEGINLGGEEIWLNNGLEERPLQSFFNLRLTTGKAFGFSNQTGGRAQYLEVTDSTGRVLKPAVFHVNGLLYGANKGGDVVDAFVSGASAELPSAGAEWVRLKGALRVMMHHVCESPVHELPLVQGAELNIPSPKVKEAGDDSGDVAQAGDISICRLRVEQVERKANHEVEVKVSLFAELSDLFTFDSFELVDEKGSTVQADEVERGGFSGNNGYTWIRKLSIGKAPMMKKLRLKIKYWGEGGMVTVPVDEVVGLGGPVSRKEAGVGGAGDRKKL